MNTDQQYLIEQHIEAQLRQCIAAEIQHSGGKIPFDKFMDMALYLPGLGYYVSGLQKFGVQGDFITAPEISPAFGYCLANQCAEWLALIAEQCLLEFGAGSGILAVQILRRLESIGQLPTAYLILEPSAELQTRQKALLQQKIPHLFERCHWLTSIPENFTGIIIANELLDAFPVSRFVINNRGDAEEVFVCLKEENTSAQRDAHDLTWPSFTAINAQPETPSLQQAVRELVTHGITLSSCYTSEINLRQSAWITEIAAHLEQGAVLIFDYGYDRYGYYHEDRHTGTLACYFRHQLNYEWQQRVGRQDITADIDFSALADQAVHSGLALLGYTTQTNFLVGAGITDYVSEIATAVDPTEMAKIQQILSPTIMGEHFKAIAFAKGISSSGSGFAPKDLATRL